jgi:signal transduction histidine kinase
VLASRPLLTLRRLERNLIRVRWFGVAFGLFQFWQLSGGPPGPALPDYVRPVGYGLVGALAIANLLLTAAVHRTEDARSLRRIGLVAFGLDTAMVFGLLWLFSYNPQDTTWVLLYIRPLEGALRYQLSGAMWAVGLALVSELARELFRAATLPNYPFFISSVTFRVGIDAIIALVAGIMARSLDQQAALAEDRASQFEDVARREAAARKELAAFHTAVMAGVAAEDLETALQSMVRTVAADLDLETLSIAIIEDGVLRPMAVHGLSPDIKQMRLQRGEGITGQAWARGEPLLVEDVTTDRHYVLTDPTIRSELAVPLRVGGEIIGILDVESRRPGALTPASLDLLSRLADQVALVVNNASALSRQRQTVARLRELDEMKSDFVAITSHELRTPLTSIVGFVETLRRKFDRLSAEQIEEFLSVISNQSRKLARLVEDLLVVSRIEAGSLSITPQDVDLDSFVAEVLTSFDSDVVARVHVEVNVDGRVLLDPNRVDQVLRNLIQNALKFSPPSSRVDVEARRVGRDLELVVRDRGIGIASHEVEQIFDRFHQAGDALTREQEGAGLGLYITRRLVAAMGGTIEVSSELGRGSEFRVTLPQDSPAPRARPRPPEVARAD